MKTNYGVARTVCTIVECIGWVIVLVGAGVVILSLFERGSFGANVYSGIISGVGMAVTGFFMIMGAQVTRANVDNADYTREIMEVIKNLQPGLTNGKNEEIGKSFDF